MDVVDKRTNLMATVWELRRLVPAIQEHGRQVKTKRTLLRRNNQRQTFKNDTKRAFADFTANAVVDAYKVCSGSSVLAHGGEEKTSPAGGEEKAEEGPALTKRLKSHHQAKYVHCTNKIHQYWYCTLQAMAEIPSTTANTSFLIPDCRLSAVQTSAPTALYRSHTGLSESHQNRATGPGNVAMILPCFLSDR